VHRRSPWLLSVVAVALAACGTGSPPSASSPPLSAVPPSPTVATSASLVASAAPITIVDDAGRSVAIAAPPTRIVSAAPSATELAFAAGLGEKVVAVDKFSNFPPEAKSRVSIGNYTKPDLETILGARPDLVLATDVHAAELVPALESRGITVVVLAAKNIEGVMLNLELLGHISGHVEEASAVTAALRERVAAVERKVAGAPTVRVFYELDPTLFTAGPGTFIDDVIRRAGGTNIASGASGDFPQLSPEDVIAADPEVILLADEAAGATPRSVAERAGWSRIAAVKAGRVASMDPDIGSRPGPRVVDALEQIAVALHPGT
jgi:iron complex transport system substrate-binding protein